MSLSSKILIFIFATILLCLGGFLVYKQIETANKINDIQKSIVEQKQLLDNITRAQSQYATKEDIDAFAKQHNVDLDIIKQDLATLDAKIVAIGNITAVSSGQNNSNVPSTSTTPNPSPSTTTSNDPNGYMKNTQNLQLTEKFSNTEVPIGQVSFSAWRDKPWDFIIAERKYSITSVLGQSENGQHYSYSKFAIQADGKTYDVKIDNNQFLEEYPTAKFSWFNPKLALGMDGTVGVSKLPVQGEFTPNVGVSIMSYGKTTTSPDILVLQPNIGYGVVSKTVQIGLSPVQFNVGKAVAPSLMSNTYVGPTMQLGTNGDIGVGVGVRVGL